ncbi:MAG TPA: glycoside hydrolase family 99-like domain-containing protein, partial [Acidimicrobiales bacterium]|nr:glycoside hydrolase family 99-like domain-containing protein [Acidimicrobiales bacterium]
MRPRFVALYLPQFHPIPENDRWWGDGFTEWTNVRRGRPRFPGHPQPHVPGELGYYDLREPGVRHAQAALATAHGVDAFCYYHYWFNGKRLLERPFTEVLRSGEPDHPFCLCWANEDWTRAWAGASGDVLMRQAYGPEDDLAHIRSLLASFADPRYLRVHGKPLFLVYRASRLPEPRRTTDVWRAEAQRAGVGELFLCRVESFRTEHGDPRGLGFDAAVEFQPDWTVVRPSPLRRVAARAGFKPSYTVYDHGALVAASGRPPAAYPRFPCVTPCWD